MQKYTSKWFLLLTSVAVVGVLGTVCLTVANGDNYAASNGSITVANNVETISTASVWDRATESYSGNKEITVYRSSSCGCCGVWVEHMQKHGFIVQDIKTEEMETIKQKYNLPQQLESCHTAIIDGYVMEGHIPADDIKRFLKQKPDVAGLAVPGMPLGTPGMEAGERKQPFAVLAFKDNGAVEVFNEYQSY